MAMDDGDPFVVNGELSIAVRMPVVVSMVNPEIVPEVKFPT